jgi:hypothetical protein
MVLDIRRIVGSQVHAKALHDVSNNAECSRRYGAGKTTKQLQGTVVEVEEVQRAGNSRLSCFITADFDLGGGDMKRVRLNIRSVKSGEIPPVVPLVDPVTPPLPLQQPAPPIPPEIPLVPPVDPAPGDQVNNPEIPLVPPVDPAPGDQVNNAPPPPPPPPPGRQPTATAHATAWCEDDDACQMHMGGNVPFREWSIRTVVGHWLGPGSDSRKSMSRFECFLLMFPPDQLSAMVTLTSEKLLSKNKVAMTPGKSLKFIGVLILSTRFEFGARASL